MSRISPPQSFSPHVPLIWYARCPTLTAMSLAANRGVFQREFGRRGIHMISVRENSTPDVQHGHLDHSLSNLIREADAATAIWAHAQNARSRLLAVGQTWHSVSIVARPGATVNGLSDLTGRRLSLPRETGVFSPARVRALRAWETILNVQGVPLKDIEFATVVADQPSAPFGDVARRETEALLGGHTDVALAFGAKGLQLARVANLHEVHRFSAEEIRGDPRLSGLVELRALTVDHPLLDANPEVIVSIVATLREMEPWARNFPGEALRHIAVEGKVEPSDAATAYGSLIADGCHLGLGPDALSAIHDLRQWMEHRHVIPAPHELTEWTLGEAVFPRSSFTSNYLTV